MSVGYTIVNSITHLIICWDHGGEGGGGCNIGSIRLNSRSTTQSGDYRNIPYLLGKSRVGVNYVVGQLTA